MSRNPIVPYAIIAVLGIIGVIIISYIGVNQREAIENPEAAADEAVVMDADEIYSNSCASCHGDDLSGASAPDLTQVGSKLSEDEIKDIIINGTDAGMPGGLVDVEQAAILAEWLSEQ